MMPSPAIPGVGAAQRNQHSKAYSKESGRARVLHRKQRERGRARRERERGNTGERERERKGKGPSLLAAGAAIPRPPAI